MSNCRIVELSIASKKHDYEAVNINRYIIYNYINLFINFFSLRYAFDNSTIRQLIFFLKSNPFSRHHEKKFCRLKFSLYFCIRLQQNGSKISKKSHVTKSVFLYTLPLYWFYTGSIVVLSQGIEKPYRHIRSIGVQMQKCKLISAFMQLVPISRYVCRSRVPGGHYTRRVSNRGHRPRI